MKHVLMLGVFLLSTAVIEAVVPYTETEEYRQAVEKYSQPVEQLPSKRPPRKKKIVNRNSAMLKIYAAKMCELREAGNVEQAAVIYRDIIRLFPELKSRIKNIENEKCLIFSSYNFNSLSPEDLHVFSELLINNKTCLSKEDIQISESGMCCVKIFDGGTSAKNTDSKMSIEDRVAESKSCVDFLADQIVKDSAERLFTASSIMGAILAIDGMKQHAYNCCETDPGKWGQYLEPLRNFSKDE